MDGLLVRQPYADLIAVGKKTWEIRLRPIALPDEFYILATKKPFEDAGPYDPSRLGVVVGIGRAGRVLGPFTVTGLSHHNSKHRATQAELARYARGRELYALEIRGMPVSPMTYAMKPGAVTIIRDVRLI